MWEMKDRKKKKKLSSLVPVCYRLKPTRGVYIKKDLAPLYHISTERTKEVSSEGGLDRILMRWCCCC